MQADHVLYVVIAYGHRSSDTAKYTKGTTMSEILRIAFIPLVFIRELINDFGLFNSLMEWFLQHTILLLAVAIAVPNILFYLVIRLTFMILGPGKSSSQYRHPSRGLRK